ncbi:MAG: hypothetical protein AAGJ18_15220 [Bacteroidota bacterium]
MVTNRGDRNSLIFTLDYGDHIAYDTLQNCVHPPKYGNGTDGYEIVYNLKKIKNFLWPESDEGDSFTFYGNVDGDLPKVVEMQWIEQRDNQKQTPMGIKLREQASVKIEVKTKKGELVKTIVDRILEAGQYDFIFPHINIKKGTYQLFTTVDGQTQSQYFRVKRTRKSYE